VLNLHSNEIRHTILEIDLLLLAKSSSLAENTRSDLLQSFVILVDSLLALQRDPHVALSNA